MYYFLICYLCSNSFILVKESVRDSWHTYRRRYIYIYIYIYLENEN